MEVVNILSLEIDEEMAGRTADGIADIVNDPEIDTVVEVMGGIHPAFEYLKAAMEQKKNVVTANKAVVAACYDELIRLAKENGVCFRCTAAVGGSIPWLVNIERALRVNRISEVGGIMNGTTNFILDKMLKERSEFDGVLKEAQDLGYAEKNPSADIDGDDIRRKLLISSNVAFGVSLKEEDIPTFGIRTVRQKDIAWGAQKGLTLKFKSYTAADENGHVTAAYVEPVFLGPEDVMAAIPANYNMVSYTGNYCGIQSFMGEGAGRFPTAHNVVEDLIDILKTPETFYTEAFLPEVPGNRVMHQYYVRTAGETDDFIKEHCRKEEAGILILEAYVDEMHAYAAKKLAEDPDFFMAAIG